MKSKKGKRLTKKVERSTSHNAEASGQDSLGLQKRGVMQCQVPRKHKEISNFILDCGLALSSMLQSLDYKL